MKFITQKKKNKLTQKDALKCEMFCNVCFVKVRKKNTCGKNNLSLARTNEIIPKLRPMVIFMNTN